MIDRGLAEGDAFELFYGDVHHSTHAAPHGSYMADAARRSGVGGGWLLGISVETLVRVYGHHSPDHLKAAAGATTGKGQLRVSVVESVVGKNQSRGKVQKSQ